MTQPALRETLSERNVTPVIAGGGAPVFGRTVTRVNDANANPAGGFFDQYVSIRGLTVDRTVTLPAAPTVGQIVSVKCEDGSLAVANIIISGGGNTIDNAPSYTMTLAQDGAFGAIEMIFVGAGKWDIV